MVYRDRAVMLSAVFLFFTSTATAAHDTGSGGSLTLLAVIFLLLAGLAAVIYYRVQEQGLFPFLSPSVAEEE